MIRQGFYGAAGDAVSTGSGLFRHWGIHTLAGTVIANSRKHGRVVEYSLEEFSEGKDVFTHGRFGNLGPMEIESRARSQLGRRYDLLSFNCEHFVRYAHGVPPVSKQVLGAIALAIGAALVIARA